MRHHQIFAIRFGSNCFGSMILWDCCFQRQIRTYRELSESRLFREKKGNLTLGVRPLLFVILRYVTRFSLLFPTQILTYKHLIIKKFTYQNVNKAPQIKVTPPSTAPKRAASQKQCHKKKQRQMNGCKPFKACPVPSKL